ncbi:cellulase family glycosylhydrolase [Actinomadura xylanilytica]|uniref:cellulase family glycosylhydrolase n=1 Tax=Actinomadura xylanilytica TaxID=887459 RepID=UPI00255A847F|nr:cellulase family glycosylhydrolase [Actinomadura xylanilytica]MDL4776344.1 cellulase family glycosylhydrolase [Actinomadura xylanilytica]
MYVTGVLALLIVIGAVADPVGFFALYGDPGDFLPVTRWQAAPLLVYVPLLLAGTAWTARSFGRLGRRDRFAVVWAGIVLSALVAKFAMSLVATAPHLDPADLLWATSFTVPKAALWALLPAAASLVGRPVESDATVETGTAWPVAASVTALVAATGPWVAARWSADLPDGAPSLSPEAGPLALAAGLAVLFVALTRAQTTFARRARNRTGLFLGGWLATLWAGAALGLVQTAAIVLADGFGSVLQTPAALYLRISEGVSLGAAFGWAAGLAALALSRREHAMGAVPPPRLLAAATAWTVLAVGAVVAATGSSAATTAPAGRTTGDVLPLSAVRGDRPRIVDAAGRQVLLRGVNVNQLVDFHAPRPGVPATRPLTEDDYRQMAGLGFNVVRLALSWSKIEPSPGRYDQGYLARADQAIGWAREHGLYTVLDLHQDGWNNQPTPPGASCPPGTSPMDGYDGAPAWATRADGAPRCQFTGRDISPAGDRAFTNFYYDRDGVQARLVKTWGMLAARYGGDPSIAGYDPLNEPGFGEQAPITSTLLLGRFYDRVLREIRARESRPHLFFFEPSIFWSGTGFDALPRGSFRNDPNLVFAPHLYGESITMDASLGLPPVTTIEHGFTLAARTAKDIPVWSGEWGFWGDAATVRAKVRRYSEQEDAHRIGGAFWVWKQACGDPQNGIGPIGNGFNKVDCATGKDLPRDPVAVEELSRAYPRAVPGRLRSLSTPTARTLRLTGEAARGGCDLDVWVPGDARPMPDGENVSGLTVRQVPGGWRLTGCATGRYRLTVG